VGRVDYRGRQWCEAGEDGQAGTRRRVTMVSDGRRVVVVATQAALARSALCASRAPATWEQRVERGGGGGDSQHATAARRGARWRRRTRACGAYAAWLCSTITAALPASPPPTAHAPRTTLHPPALQLPSAHPSPREREVLLLDRHAHAWRHLSPASASASRLPPLH
jgi:hypothetical protein